MYDIVGVVVDDEPVEVHEVDVAQGAVAQGALLPHPNSSDGAEGEAAREGVDTAEVGDVGVHLQ